MTVIKGPAILAIGSELLDGRVHESNALYVSQAFSEYGLPLSGVALCDDVEGEIIDALDHLAKYSSVILVSGGLGPTTDDLTREVIAAYCGVKLYQDEQALTDIKALFEKRKRNFNPINAKQAQLPVGSTIIVNPIGTAPGFYIETVRNGKKLLLLALPGVPSEFIKMFNQTVKDKILSYLGGINPPAKGIVRCFGLSESEIGGRIEALKLDSSLTISYRAYFPEIQVKIIHPNNHKLVEESMQRVEETLGRDFIFARSFESSFEEVILSKLKSADKTVAFAESCTGGAIGDLITNIAGASSVFMGSAVVYANQAKSDLIDVPIPLIENHGAVSAEVAEAMAKGALKKYKTSLALSVTGIAGPDGGSEEKPVGCYFIGLADEKGCQTFKLFFLSTRKNFKRYVAHVALDIIRRHISGLSLDPYNR